MPQVLYQYVPAFCKVDGKENLEASRLHTPLNDNPMLAGFIVGRSGNLDLTPIGLRLQDEACELHRGSPEIGPTA